MKEQMTNNANSNNNNVSLSATNIAPIKENCQDDNNDGTTIMLQSSAATNCDHRKEEESSEKKKMASKYQIFLGGSCNPTTWRHQVAIPILKNFGITFYNPQVDDWTPEMVQLESRAKSDAEILFFVIDKQTRSTVGMIESAFIAGSNKRLILVIYPFSIDTNTATNANNEMICFNTPATPAPVSTTTPTTNRITKNTSLTTVASTTSIMTSSSASSLSSMSIPTSSTQSSSDSSSSFDATINNNFGYSPIRISGEYITAIEFSELRRARLLLQDLVLNQNIPIFCDTKLALIHAIQCLKDNSIVSHIDQATKQEKEEEEEDGHKPQGSKRSHHHHNHHHHYEESDLTNNSSSISGSSTHEFKDIYLCLTDCDQSWRDTKALPWFYRNGLSCNFVPNAVDGHATDILLIRKEINAIERSRILLFVVTNKCRGLSVMLLAAHYMSLGREDVVLCIQYLEEPCIIGGETLSKTAVADYNRGRIYLNDHARNSHVPVFNNLDEAIEYCGRRGKIGLEK